MPTQKEYDDLQAQYQGFKDSYHKLQVQLDAALQKNQDDAAAHAKVMVDSDAKQASVVAAMGADAQIAIQRTKDNAESELTNVKADLMATIDKLKSTHAAEISTLKEKYLLPAVKDLHARQQADIAAKHKAEMDSLLKG